ncbi:MAG: ParB/RepB/Spo0J family partition protein, partial [Holdemanella sp.]|nr:ParB/RepB/Spo0J family partition protein [Holdemanella sp.]
MSGNIQIPSLRRQTLKNVFGIEGIENSQLIDIEFIHPFKNHPFKVIDDERMDDLVNSIKEYGVLSPVLLRKTDDMEYEMISGHRRMHACRIAGLEKIPAIIRDMTDEEATLTMVDANIQREELLPSEKAFAYRMKLEAIKHQGIGTDTEGKRTSGQVGPKLKGQRSNKIVADQAGESVKQVQRYIRLTYLIPELLEMVDR